MLFQQQETSLDAIFKDITALENGFENGASPSNGISNDVDGHRSKEGGRHVDDHQASSEDERGFPGLHLIDVPGRKGNTTDDEGRLTPSGTLSRQGTLDELVAFCYTL